MRNKNNKSAADDVNDDKSGRGYRLKLIPWSIATFWGVNKFCGTSGTRDIYWWRRWPYLEAFKHKRDGRRSETAENIKLSITRSFFELETPNLAWKFGWTIRTKYKTYKKFLKSTKVQSTYNSASYRLQILHGSSYRPNYKVQKYKKFQKFQKWKSTLRTTLQKSKNKKI